MKLHPDTIQGPSLSAYGDGWVAINGEKVSQSVVISAMGHRFDWNCDAFECLHELHFEKLCELGAEIVIFGSGARLRFAPAALLGSLNRRRIGLESMDTQAACRTYNFLAGEGRKVVAALLL
jgi:uncharacterized protein